MSNVSEQTKLPEGFAEWAKTYFAKPVEPEIAFNLDELFNNAYIRFRRSVESQLANASKVDGLKGTIDRKFKVADEEESIPKLQELVKEVTEALKERRKAVDVKLSKLYQTAVWENLDLKRDPNEARDTIRGLLKSWDIAEAERQLNRFDEEIKRSKTLDLGNMKSIEERHEENKLQNAQFARNAQQALAVATRLIGGDGQLLLDSGFMKDLAMVATNDLPSLIEEIEQSEQSEMPQSIHALSMLKRLQTDEDLREKLESVEGPSDQTSTSAELIRATLGLEAGTEVTDAHARQAALSGLLFKARQTKVGSCFTTATAVMVQRNNPEQFLEDVTSLFKDGKVTRTVRNRDNGNLETVEVKITKEMLSFNLSKKQQVGRSDSNLHMAPDMIASMNALGVPAEEQKKAMEDAARDIRCERALDAALGKIDDRYFKSPNKKSDIRAAALEKLRNDTSLSIRDGLEQVFNERNVIVSSASAGNISESGLQRSASRKGTMLSECGKFDAPDKTDEFSPHELLEALVKRQISDEGEREAKLQNAEDAFLGQQDNFVQRAWEYSIATMEEKMPGKYSQKDSMCYGIWKGAHDHLNDYADGHGTWNNDFKNFAKNTNTTLCNHFHSVASQGLDSRYDPSVTTKDGAVSQDGNSAFGGICLYIGDTKIETEKQFVDYLKLKLGEAKTQTGTGYNEPAQRILDELANELESQFTEEAFQNKIISAACGGNVDKIKKMAKPWMIQKGGVAEDLTQLYYNSPDPLQKVVSPNTVDNAEKLATFLVDTMLQMKVGDNISPENSEHASITVRNGVHGYNLKPGNPVLLSMLKEYDNPQEAIQAFKGKEQEKNTQRGNTKLSFDTPLGGAAEKIIGQFVSIFPKEAKGPVTTAIVEAVTDEHGDEATLTQLRAVAQQVVKNQLETRFPSLSEQKVREWVTTSQSRSDAVILESVIPKGEFAPMIDHVMNQQGVPEEKQDELRKALLDTDALKKNDGIDREAFAKLISTEMGKLSLDHDPGKLESSMIGQRGLVIADTNWGSGDHMTIFSMVVNPRTQEMELWQMNEDGTNARKQDQDKWTKNSPWHVFNDPSQYGGSIGNSDWEEKRGELQRKLMDCVKKEVGDINAMQVALEIADERFDQGDQDKADKALENLETKVNAALALAEKKKTALEGLKKVLSEIDTLKTLAEAKTATRVIQQIVRSVESLRDASEVDGILNRHSKLVELLKEDDLGAAVDLTTILAA